MMQTETRSFGATESDLEDLVEILLGNPRAVVAKSNRYSAPVVPGRAEPNAPGTRLTAVAHKIVDKDYDLKGGEKTGPYLRPHSTARTASAGPLSSI